jgi:glycosyltransferase involved in cell wall biosynthesis
MLKILCLSKRRPQGRDLLTRPYGRFYYLPVHLAGKGFSVKVVLTSYQNDPKIVQKRDGIEWHSLSLKPFSMNNGVLDYFRDIDTLAKEFKPDWIVGFSDTWYGIMAYFLAQKHMAKSVIDAYDNYESYLPWAKPLHWLWRYCLKRATILTAAGQGLATLVSKGRKLPADILPMAADPCFYPIDRNECRQKLNLPLNKKLVGYSGAIYRNRGIELLFSAFEQLQKELPNVQLVLTGRKQDSIEIPKEILWLGYLKDEQMPLLMNSLDLLVVLNKQSSFGKYSHPSKLYEALRCQIPVVVTDTEGVRWILRNETVTLVQPGNVVGLAREMRTALNDSGKTKYRRIADWDEILEEFLNSYC